MKNDGGPAFPSETPIPDGGTCEGSGFPTQSRPRGMSLRDWFAGQALAVGALMSATRYLEADKLGTPAEIMASLVADAYATADAMIAERSKP